MSLVQFTMIQSEIICFRSHKDSAVSVPLVIVMYGLRDEVFIDRLFDGQNP
jgi:hypothetical protein